MGHLYYFNLSSEMLSRTSSHICGRWYLPTFLFKDGLLTLMYRASFIALLRLFSSLPIMLKWSTPMSWPVMVWWSNMGEGAFWCSLNLSAKILEDSPMYSKGDCTFHPRYHINNCRMTNPTQNFIIEKEWSLSFVLKHPQTIHNCSLLQGVKWIIQEKVQQLWCTSIL